MLRAWKRNTNQPYDAPNGYNADPTVTHEQKENPEHIPDTKVTLSFGQLTVPNLVKKLSDEDPAIVEGAVAVLANRVLSKPSNVTIGAKCMIVPPLNQLIARSIRQEATRLSALKSLALMAGQLKGRQALLEHGTIPALRDVLEDKNQSVAIYDNAYAVLVNLSASTQSISGVINSKGLIDFLVRNTELQPGQGTPATACAPSVKAATMGVLLNCMRHPDGVQLSLNAGAVEATTDKLNNKDEKVRLAAVKLLQALCLVEEGRVKAVSGGKAIQNLVTLLKDWSALIRRASIGVLMSLTIDKPGKAQMFQYGMIVLVNCLTKEKDKWVKQNAMKVVSMMAVMPAARDALKVAGVVEAIENIAKYANEDLTTEIASTAIDAVLWEP